MAQRKKRGTPLGFRIFDFYISMGIGHAYALLYFVALHYLIFDRKAVRAAREYINARFGNPGLFARLMHTYKLFVNTGRNLVDLRCLERTPEKVYMECDTRRIKELVREGKGLLMFTAHVGNWQVMMRNLPALGVRINIVIRREENPAVREFLQIDCAERHSFNIIDPSEGPEAVLEMMRELDAGNVVSIMGDRSPEGGKSFQTTFFGHTSSLPEGPYRIAAAARSPAIVLMTRRDGPCRYTLEVNEPALPPENLSRKEKINYYSGKYIKVLEEFLAKHPYEWTPAGML